MCLFNVFLDLETFPQMSQAWETPLIWFASMCRGIAMYGPCFPQTLQVEFSFSRTCREVVFCEHWLYLVVLILQFHIYPVIAIKSNCCVIIGARYWLTFTLWNWKWWCKCATWTLYLLLWKTPVSSNLPVSFLFSFSPIPRKTFESEDKVFPVVFIIKHRKNCCPVTVSELIDRYQRL